MLKKSTISYILRGENRLKVMDSLREEEKVSSQLEKENDMYKSHVSRTLKELKEKDLIKCTNPHDRNFKFYKLTPKGKEVLKKAKEIVKESV